MNLPSSIGELTVDQFQALFKIYQSKEDEVEKGIKATVLLSGWSFKEVNAIDWVDMKKIFSHISYMISEPSIKAFEKNTHFKPILVVDGKCFKACMASEFSTAQYVDLKNLSVDWIGNLHLLMCGCYLPVNLLGRKKKYDGSKIEKLSQSLKKAKLKDVVGLLFFYSNVLERLSPTIQMSLDEATKTIQKQIVEIMNDSEFLQSVGAGDLSSIKSLSSTESKKMKSMSGT